MESSPFQDVNYRRFDASFEYLELLKDQANSVIHDRERYDEVVKLQEKHLVKMYGYYCEFAKKYPEYSLRFLADKEVRDVQQRYAELGIEKTPEEVRRIL